MKKKRHSHRLKKPVGMKEIKKVERMEVLADKIYLPKDMLADSVQISVVGKNYLRLDNFKGILDYTEAQVKILSKDGRILVKGKKLQISYCSDFQLCIVGRIEQIQYLE